MSHRMKRHNVRKTYNTTCKQYNATSFTQERMPRARLANVQAVRPRRIKQPACKANRRASDTL